MHQKIKVEFIKLQEQNNLRREMEKSYRNLMQCIVKFNRKEPWLYQNLMGIDHADLSLAFLEYMLKRIEEFDILYREGGMHIYNTKQLSGFLVMGFFGYYGMSVRSELPASQIDAGALQLLDELVQSKVFR